MRGATLTDIYKIIQYLFQSTRPVRGATWQSRYRPTKNPLISIHAPRAGRDKPSTTPAPRAPHFNPRAPCGARRRASGSASHRRHFNPRAPCGARPPRTAIRRLPSYFNPRAPCGARQIVQLRKENQTLFQSTRPVRGATEVMRCYSGHFENFNPRAPCGARLALVVRIAVLTTFQSTRPVRGATGGIRHDGHHHPISIHAPRAGRDLLC